MKSLRFLSDSLSQNTLRTRDGSSVFPFDWLILFFEDEEDYRKMLSCLEGWVRLGEPSLVHNVYYRELEYHVHVTDYSNWMEDLDVYGYGSDGKKVYYCISRTYPVVSKVWSKGFEEGDSIAKEYGSLELKVIRKDTVITLLPYSRIIQEYLLDNDSINL